MSYDDNSLPNDELASQNMISVPDEIEDSQASDYTEVKNRNFRKTRVYGEQNNAMGASLRIATMPPMPSEPDLYLPYTSAGFKGFNSLNHKAHSLANTNEILVGETDGFD